MEARMKNPALILEGALQALLDLGKAIEKAGVPPATLALIHLRASQINGCSVCVDAGFRDLKKVGERDTRIFTVAAWRDAPYFSDAERAALALTEAVTRLSERMEGIPDDVWAEIVRHYDEPSRAALVLAIAQSNIWNRLNVTVRQVAGTPWN
ncbi:carboxymuconolactone decarboxylase family protein [Reyranella sp. CPCC 100927]|uniref:carboxymuconolactone decarboxylase family protein n=1 Tax=Reyranella sp. CPCC 100927 TaxID=2599616 RepID=UPI0011B82059|nr:carboxymuconolactone decarboxylase family protein [Reyranella sp. CPCC 100927]TWS96153.1 carboxymuconolactone decarboxylase family protein [Reyranella sp. CPCC 100927]